MHDMPVALTCCALVFGLAAADARAEAVKVTPELTVFTEQQAPPADNRPTVLRGSATKRGTVDGRYGDAGYEPSRFQFGAGDKLWLTDPISGEVIVCDERRTSRVGSRFIGCLQDRLPYVVYE
ncbi:MAG: hypothetical protein ACR2RF_33470 [Geminicoccaceae bacterium]